MRSRNFLFIVASLTGAWAFSQGATSDPAPPPEVQAALTIIRPESLRGDLSFIASDLLEGRDSPSRGLDLAAGYIAAQFQIAGLEPAAGSSYFQSAEMLTVAPSFANFELKISQNGREFSAGPKNTD